MEKTKVSKSHAISMGVVKFSHKKAGYPDISKIAIEWSKDPNFYQVIIRKVSRDDFGIQFIYYVADENGEGNSNFMETYVNPNKESIYAYDIAHSSGSRKEVLEGILKNELIA